jgi:integrase
LRFFFRKVLKRPWDGDEMPYPKKKIHLPVIWSPEEVTSLIDAAPIPFYRTILMTLYGTGVRRAECAALKLTDIDSARMVVHVQEGKGGKDRDIVLLRRFFLHVLPTGFVRIRHFGFFAHRRRATLLPLCFELLAKTDERQAMISDPPADAPRPLWRCPRCGGPMVIVERFTASEARLRAPPAQRESC